MMKRMKMEHYVFSTTITLMRRRKMKRAMMFHQNKTVKRKMLMRITKMKRATMFHQNMTVKRMMVRIKPINCDI
jgi:hypothetical protein